MSVNCSLQMAHNPIKFCRFIKKELIFKSNLQDSGKLPSVSGSTTGNKSLPPL